MQFLQYTCKRLAVFLHYTTSILAVFLHYTTSILAVFLHYTTSILAVYWQYTCSILALYHQYTCSILALYHQYTCSILALYHQYTCSILALYHQYTCSILAVYHQYTCSLLNVCLLFPLIFAWYQIKRCLPLLLSAMKAFSSMLKANKKEGAGDAQENRSGRRTAGEVGEERGVGKRSVIYSSTTGLCVVCRRGWRMSLLPCKKHIRTGGGGGIIYQICLFFKIFFVCFVCFVILLKKYYF